MPHEQNLIDRIKLLFELKKYDMAIGIFKSDSGLMDNRYALFLAGRSYIRLKKDKEALLLFNKALSIDPFYGSAKLEVAKYYADSDPERAIKLVWECIDYNPLEPAYWGVLGSTRFKQKKFKEAAEAFEKYLELDPNDHRSVMNLAACKDELGLSEEALPLYELAISIHPNYAHAYLNLAVHYSDNGQLEKAEELYFTALQMNPNSATTIYGLACVYALKKEEDKAFQFLEQSIEMDEKYRTYVLTDVDFEELKKHPLFLKITTA